MQPARRLIDPGHLAVLALAAAALTGCESVVGDYMPLAVGNRWEYRVELHAGRVPPRAATDFIEIVEKVGRGSFRARELGRSTLWAKSGGYLSRFDGEWREAILVLPPHTGYRWRVNSMSGSRFYEIEPREKVTVPAGEFPECVKVSSRGISGKHVTYYWFASQVGLIKQVRIRAGKPVETRSLVRCRLQRARGSRQAAPLRPPPRPDPEPEPEPVGP